MLQPRPHWISKLLIALFCSANVFAYSEYSSTTKYCYSCMSEDFLLHWPYLDEVYYRPLNFTDHCFKMTPSANIGTMPCSHSMCVTVIEPRILAGQHIGNNIIRGCFSGVFKYGSTPKSQSQQVLDTSCSRMPAHKLLPPRLAARSSNRTVELCWCAGQLCNYYPSVAINHSTSLHVIAALPIFLVLILCSFWS
ncbi:Protein quiver [Caenorhabditis elegans]|uniref:Protein quiver n=1 Tax=Caenorhabditis elegans TaxID=6239 RepID=Q966F7_CAEEL|nr:Protein quiver [Caenorhabditis elegans]CCD67539.1 Protein quiver [Caenorhabditis elegans]|eukprot:NP_508222.2 Homolog of Odr-2 (Two) [Caenorhabditis elegans]